MEVIKTDSFEIAANISGNREAPAVAILMPGRLDTKDYANFAGHAEYLSRKGFLVAAIDPPYTWDSPGDLERYTTSNYLKAVHELIQYFGNRPTLFLGHSRGGATAALATSNPAVAGIVLVNAAYGAPTAPEPKKMENGKLVEYRDLPPGDVRTREKRRFDLSMAYFEDGALHNPEATLREFDRPKLIIHANQDEFTGLDKIKTIYDALPDPKAFLEINCTHDYRLFPAVIEEVNRALGIFLETNPLLNDLGLNLSPQE